MEEDLFEKDMGQKFGKVDPRFFDRVELIYAPNGKFLEGKDMHVRISGMKPDPGRASWTYSIVVMEEKDIRDKAGNLSHLLGDTNLEIHGVPQDYLLRRKVYEELLERS